jgi:hypothetical protein
MKLLLPIVFVLCCGVSTAQFGPQQIISNTAQGSFRVIPYDMNNDGFMDVVGASNDSWKIAWFENLDGQGNFSAERVINTTAITIDGLEMVDIDDDGDMDILYKTSYQDKIAWMENLDGLGTFGPERLVADTNYPYTISTADIDSDGDMDIFANVYHNGFFNRLVWYENVDGLGNYSSENVIEIGDFYISTLLNFDLDNDGDLDLITSYESYGPSQIIWYENLDGQGGFSESQEIYQFDYFSDWVSIHNLSYSDINGDGKIDLLVETYHEDFTSNIFWLENLDASGTFSDPQHIHTLETTLGSLRSYDLDNDEDNDILVSFFFSSNYTSIAWFENTDGLGDFGSKQIISTQVVRARDATAADLNSDGSLDVISASSNDNKIAWYANLNLGVSENTQNNFITYPNPVKEFVSIFPQDQIASVALSDEIGQRIEVHLENNIMDLSGLASGVYFLKISGRDGAIEIQKIIKR